jgi:hypothetical protein
VTEEVHSAAKHDTDIKYPADKREKYWMIMEKTVSESAASDFYNTYANEHGFSIRK